MADIRKCEDYYEFSDEKLASVLCEADVKDYIKHLSKDEFDLAKASLIRLKESNYLAYLINDIEFFINRVIEEVYKETGKKVDLEGGNEYDE